MSDLRLGRLRFMKNQLEFAEQSLKAIMQEPGSEFLAANVEIAYGATTSAIQRINKEMEKLEQKD